MLLRPPNTAASSVIDDDTQELGSLKWRDKMAAIIGDAALRAVNERKGSLEADRGEHRAERLAGLGRIDRQRFAGEILLTIFRRLGPFADALDFGGIAGILEHLLLVRQHLLVFRTAEQLEMIEHVVCILRHGGTLSKCRVSIWLAGSSAIGESRSEPVTPPPSVSASARSSRAPWSSSRSAS